MSQPLLAALDVGTSRVKGSLVGWQDGGRAVPLAAADAALGPVRTVGLRAEQDPAELAAALRCVVAALAARAPPATWAAVALTTQRGTLLPLAGDGSPAAPLISWLDRRGVEVGGDRWSWFERHAGDVVARTARLASLMGWLTLGLTGESWDTPQTAPAEAGRRGPASPCAAPGKSLTVSGAELAAALGLPRGLALILAGGDKNSELVGAGCVAPGSGVVSFGTAVSLGTLLASGQTAEAYLTPAHVPGLTQAEVGLPFGGGVYAWLGALLGDAAMAVSDADLSDDAPLFVPYMMGSLADAGARAGWSGVTPAATARTLAAVGVEGILLDLKLGLPRLPALTSLALTGGGSRQPAMASWLADALELPVAVAAGGDTGLAGGLMTAAVALGLACDWQAAAAALCPLLGPRHWPRPAASARWGRRLTRWRELAGL